MVTTVKAKNILQSDPGIKDVRIKLEDTNDTFISEKVLQSFCV